MNTHSFPHFAAVVLVALASSLSLPAQQTAPSPPSTVETYRRLAGEIEANLKDQILAKWFPRAIDTNNGGFFQNYNEDWSPGSAGSKAIVYESRLTWTAAQAAMRFPEQSAMYSAAARHGLDFLANKMWDQKHGGFFWSVDNNGNPPTGPGGNVGATKQEYGNGFGVYAAAAVYEFTKDPAALALAQKGFLWYDAHGHDALHGGYFEILSPDGTPDADATPAVGGGPDVKSMNSSIHMLEALTALYEVWPDPRVRTRLREMFDILRDRVFADPGYLIQFFSADWKPRPDDDSYGHDVETAYLLVEAAAALGMPEDARTWESCKKLVDHAVAVGWDKTRGGLYDSGGIQGGGYSAVRNWWVEAEMLNALLLMHEHFGSDHPQYWNAFVAEWDWINRHGLDRAHGGWWPRVNNDGSPVHGPKSDAWTECYHQGRALLNVSARLRHLAGAGASGDRIRVSGQEFRAGTRRIWINGANTPWHRWNDFGGRFDPAWWDAEFKRLHDNGINATRVWITCNGEVGINIDTNGYVSGATAAHWSDLDRLFQTAQTHQVYIMATLMSFDHFKNTHPKFLRWRRWIQSDSNIDSYVTNYVIPFVKRYQDNPFLWSFDLMNEPDWVFENAEAGQIPWVRMQTYWAKAAEAIHANSSILVTVGMGMGAKYNRATTEGSRGNVISDAALNGIVADSGAHVDFYSSHYYDWMGKIWGNAFYLTPAAYGMATDKPNILGEMPALGTKSHTTTEDYESAYEHGWQGAMGWTSDGIDSNGSLTELGPATKAFCSNHRQLIFPTPP